MPLATVVMFFAVSAAASAADPFIGEWNMVPAKSEYNGRAMPESGTVRFEPEADGLRHEIELVDPDGRGVRNTSRAKFDGKEYPALKSGQTVSRKRLDSNTFEATFKTDGMVTIRDRWSVSADGRTLTFISAGVDSTTSKAFRTITIFERQ